MLKVAEVMRSLVLNALKCGVPLLADYVVVEFEVLRYVAARRLLEEEHRRLRGLREAVCFIGIEVDHELSAGMAAERAWEDAETMRVAPTHEEITAMLRDQDLVVQVAARHLLTRTW